jgi:16S rRNA (cytosine967-C5)-methyltransferase
MPPSPARAAAFDILLRVSEQDAYAVELLHSSRLNELSPSDRGLCTELVMGVLRWQSRLDEVLRPLTSQPFSKLDAAVVIALRLAAYQLGFLQRIPARAAVNESVELTGRTRKRSAMPMVNAVLRKLAADSTAIRPVEPVAPLTPEAVARGYAHPEWLVERWAAAFGIDNAQKICAYDQHPPATTLRLPLDASAAQQIEAELKAAGVELSPGELLAGARRVVAGDVTHTAALREGRVHIQDEASQLVAALVGAGQRVLDCCAAPGGKTAAIADRNPSAQIVAADLHPHRARLLRQLVRARNVSVLTADALALPLKADFDRVLADVPCSGTGTLARNPEIKWRLTIEDLSDLQTRQVAILRSALTHITPGGRLVYSTCSLEREENSDVVEQVLKSHPEFKLLDVRKELAKLKMAGELIWDDTDSLTNASLVSGAYLRTLPGVHPCDGFFVAMVERLF